MRLKTAKTISAFSHPAVVFPVSVPFFLSQAELSGGKILFLLPILLILSLPIFYYFYALKKKKISDWEITERRERYSIYLLSLICGGVALWLLQISGSQYLLNAALIFYLLAVFVTLINFFWKICIHAAGITAGALTLNLFFGQTAFLYLLIPLVIWSRWEEKKHTPIQIFAGATLGFLVAFGVLNLRGSP